MREKYSKQCLLIKKNMTLENKINNALFCQQASKDFDDNYLGNFLFVITTIYLLLPAILTLFFFSKYPFFVMIAAFFGVVFLVKDSAFKLFSCIHIVRNAYPLFILSALIVWLSGILPPFAQNSDWYKHYGILNILVDQSWPPSVITEDGLGTLRYSIAYYVIPAIFGKVFGPIGMYIALFSLTTIGLFIAMVLAFGSNFRPPYVLFLLGTIFLLFSGADIIGFMITKVHYGPINHFELWWSIGELASNITNLFWVPQHSLPGFLVAFVVLRYPFLSLKYAGLIGACTAIWSPFAAIGVVPIYLYAVGKIGFKPLISAVNIFAAPVLLVTGAMFLLDGSSNIPIGFIYNNPRFQFDMWFVFLIVEFLGISISLLLYKRNISLIFTCVIFLVVLSLFYLGANNDLLMRASIPCLGILAILASFAVVYGENTVKKAPLILFLVIGVVTPMSEIIRAFTASRLPNPERINLLDILPSSSHNNQYFVFNGSDYIRRQAILELIDVNFQNTFGTASFMDNRRIESNEYTDAALVTGDIHLPRGAYKVEITLNWDVESKTTEKNAGHFSLHGKRLLYGINTSREQNKNIISYFYTDGGKFKFSFGLGGWSKGKGFIELKDMRIFAVKK